MNASTASAVVLTHRRPSLTFGRVPRIMRERMYLIEQSSFAAALSGESKWPVVFCETLGVVITPHKVCPKVPLETDTKFFLVPPHLSAY